jgi:hypothetical protein
VRFKERGLRRLEPARDPTIVNPELLPTEAAPTFDFSTFETQLKLPEGTLQAGFDRNPVGTLNLIVDEAAAGGGIPNATLNAIRGIVQTRINAVTNRLETQILRKEEEQALEDEVDMLTKGLIDAATGGRQEFDLDTVLDQLDRLFPDDSDDELVERAMRIQRVSRGAAAFTGRIRGQLEPRE